MATKPRMESSNIFAPGLDALCKVAARKKLTPKESVEYACMVDGTTETGWQAGEELANMIVKVKK